MVVHRPPAGLDEFVKLVRASGLLDHQRLQSAVERFHRVRPGRPPDEDFLRAFAAHLVVHGYLAPWQVEKLLKGEFEGFLLDHYRLYDHLGHDGTYDRYRAEDLTSEEHVILRSHPSNGGHTEYTVED